MCTPNLNPFPPGDSCVLGVDSLFRGTFYSRLLLERNRDGAGLVFIFSLVLRTGTSDPEEPFLNQAQGFNLVLVLFKQKVGTGLGR